IYIVLALGLAGYGMRLLDLPPAPLLLGFVLGPMIEENFVRAMRITGGDPFAFILRPVSGTIFAILAILVVWMIVSRVRGPRLVRTSEADNTAGTVNLD